MRLIENKAKIVGIGEVMILFSEKCGLTGGASEFLNTHFEKVVHNGIILRKNSVLTDRSRGSVYEAGKGMNLFTVNIVKDRVCR